MKETIINLTRQCPYDSWLLQQEGCKSLEEDMLFRYLLFGFSVFMAFMLIKCIIDGCKK